VTDPLADLRDYHAPDPVSWWPPAPGWWLLAALGVALLAGGLIWWSRRRLRRRAARLARAELADLEQEFQRQRDGVAFLRGLSRLLRRFALARFPRQDVAGLTGSAWLEFLDAQGGGGRFGAEFGALLTEGPYRPAADPPVAELARLAGAWIDHNAERRP